MANRQCPGSSQWQPVCLSLIELSSCMLFKLQSEQKSAQKSLKKGLTLSLFGRLMPTLGRHSKFRTGKPWANFFYERILRGGSGDGLSLSRGARSAL